MYHIIEPFPPPLIYANFMQTVAVTSPEIIDLFLHKTIKALDIALSARRLRSYSYWKK